MIPCACRLNNGRFAGNRNGIGCLVIFLITITKNRRINHMLWKPDIYCSGQKYSNTFFKEKNIE